MRRLSDGDIDSYSNIAKETKKKLNKVNKVKIKNLSKSKCGLENPCVFGVHNPKFNNKLV